MALSVLLASCPTVTIPPAVSAIAWSRTVAHHLFHPPSVLTAASVAELTNLQVPAAVDEPAVRAFIALPSAGGGDSLPVLVLMHEFWGLSESIVEKAQGLADELQCACIAPDLMRGSTTDFVPRAIWQAVTTPQERVNDEVDAVVRWASTEGGLDATRVAVCGFCFGGGKALRYTTQRRPSAATVVFYGSPITSSAELASLQAPVCALYGDADFQFPPPVLESFRSALKASSVEHDLTIFPGAGHAFWKDMGQVERGEEPQLTAWRKVTRFLRAFYAGEAGA